MALVTNTHSNSRFSRRSGLGNSLTPHPPQPRRIDPTFALHKRVTCMTNWIGKWSRCTIPVAPWELNGVPHNNLEAALDQDRSELASIQGETNRNN